MINFEGSILSNNVWHMTPEFQILSEYLMKRVSSLGRGWCPIPPWWCIVAVAIVVMMWIVLHAVVVLKVAVAA